MSRLFFPDPETAAAVGVRAITLDRPGIGGSDPKAEHRVADWPADVIALADALGIDRFGVIGNSAGAPYALACAALIPERLTGVAMTNSASAMIYLAREDLEVRAAVLDGDDERIMDLLASDPEAAAREVVAVGTEWVAELAEHPQVILDGGDDEGDAWFFEDPARRDMILGAIREAVRQGIDGGGAMARAARPMGVPDRGHRDTGPRLAGCQRPDHPAPRDAEADGPDPPSGDDRVGRRWT
jgi:pimeloyl-ACP methyl ester carboxylesterase